MPIAAAFTTRCGACDELILEGDPIVDEDGEWCHAECADEAEFEVFLGDGEDV